MKKLIIAALALIAVAAIGVAGFSLYIFRTLPDVTVLKHYRPAAAADVLDKDGNVLAQYYDRKFRIWIPLSDVPDMVVQTVVIAEDDTFFDHEGVNYKAVWEALQHDIQKKRFARGGSTITQQMIKNVLLSKEKTIIRKVRELILARKAEEILSKRRILEIYLNEVEWGDNIYGIEAASRYYFDKQTKELSIGEASLLAGMLPNPRYYDPFKRMDKARHRQKIVLFNMHQAKVLTDSEYEAALAAAPSLRQTGSTRFDFAALRDKNGRACSSKVLEEVLVDLYGEHDFYRKGLHIKTTIDKSLQATANAQFEAWQGHDIPETVGVIREGKDIRAVVCSPNEEGVRAFFESFGIPSNPYELGRIDPADISREDIIDGRSPQR
ncbi:MAG TPA: transglycosylase domain-containing protein [Nitrospirota bacterium]|nr:transglycosylase domain-containing protein [Nitrospirota bacterium]